MFSKRSGCAFVLTIAMCAWQAQRGNPGYALLWYLVMSRIMLQFPLLLHKSRNKFVVPPTRNGYSHLLIAHRGGSWEAPENTIQAFNYALLMGAQFLETDVRITKDGHIIVCHDEDFSRLCGDPRKVSDTNLADLPKFKQKMPMHFSKLNKDCEFQNYERKPNDQSSFSTLEEVFQLINVDVPMSIEVKDKDSKEAALKTALLIRKYKRYHSTAVGGESTSITECMLKIDPQLSTFFGITDVLKVIFGYFSGVLPFLHFERELAALPYMTRDYIKMKFEERRSQKTWGGYLFYTFYIYMFQLCNICFNPVLVHLQKRGVFTAYWVLNQEGEVLHLARTSKV